MTLAAGTAGVPTRVVLDTNVLVSLWVFADSRFALLRAAIEGGRWRALTSDACLGEFARVLDYPQFAFPAERQRQALEEYARLAEKVSATSGGAVPLPRCKDKDDQKFLELARDGAARWLVTSDRALLKLARRKNLDGLFGIVAPERAVAALAATSASAGYSPATA